MGKEFLLYVWRESTLVHAPLATWWWKWEPQLLFLVNSCSEIYDHLSQRKEYKSKHLNGMCYQICQPEKTNWQQNRKFFPSQNSDGKERDRKKKKKKKKRRPDPRKVHEDECYRCGEGGELVMCDRSWCTKAYHLECLNLIKPPNGEYSVSQRLPPGVPQPLQTSKWWVQCIPAFTTCSASTS